MANAIVVEFDKFCTGVKQLWHDLTYVSPEEQERRRQEREKEAELRRIAMEKYEARKIAAEKFARNKRIMMDALTEEGFTDEEALELVKGVDIYDEEEL